MIRVRLKNGSVVTYEDANHIEYTSDYCLLYAEPPHYPGNNEGVIAVVPWFSGAIVEQGDTPAVQILTPARENGDWNPPQQNVNDVDGFPL